MPAKHPRLYQVEFILRAEHTAELRVVPKADIITDSALLFGFWKYYVKWAGYPESDSTWEPFENLGNCERLIASFWENRGLDVLLTNWPGFVVDADPDWVAQEIATFAADSEEEATPPKRSRTIGSRSKKVVEVSQRPTRRRTASRRADSATRNHESPSSSAKQKRSKPPPARQETPTESRSDPTSTSPLSPPPTPEPEPAPASQTAMQPELVEGPNLLSAPTLVPDDHRLRTCVPNEVYMNIWLPAHSGLGVGPSTLQAGSVFGAGASDMLSTFSPDTK
ncbi:hypothetical protein B0H11DRAFT_1987187 [Mycena galericulata]|nr:hypothetical protein B0H11DRAFT_1987187 [Mycena galericulata]